MNGHQNKRQRASVVYTVRELAARLKVSRQHIFNAIDAGELNALNIGIGQAKFYRIPIAEVERWEASRNTLKGGRK